MRRLNLLTAGRVAVAAACAWCSSVAQADQLPGYGFQNAAQEITQLYWLAETANLCGWASAEDTVRFKNFAVRFLAAHLSELHKVALVSLINQSGYEGRVRQAAEEGVTYNCDSNRWHLGWTTYKTAADAHEAEY